MTSITNNYNTATTAHSQQKSDIATKALDILSGGAGGAQTKSQDLSYYLDLSPQAQQYLQGSGTSSTSGDTGFVLSKEQQQTIQTILEKYKDVPQTEDTYKQILADLTKAGLAPDQLARIDAAQSFNATQVFLEALDGTDGQQETGDEPSLTSKEQGKTTAYSQQLIAQFQAISTQG